MNSPGAPFTLYYQNCRSLNNKLIEFSLSLLSSDFDVIAITETWLKPTVLNNELFDSSYLVYRCDRSELNSLKCRGGGVLVAVKSKYKSECFQLLNFDHLEVVVVKIKINTLTLYIFCIYIYHPDLYSMFMIVLLVLWIHFLKQVICVTMIYLFY